MKPDTDIIVLGGGMAGACAATLLARQSRTVTLVEARLPAHAPSVESVDLRVSAISRATQRILTACGAWELIAAGPICSYERMVVWDEAGRAGDQGSIEFDCAEVGQPNLGHIVENRRLQWALLEQARAAGARIVEARVSGLSAGGGSMTVELENGERLGAALAVAADGADSPARKMMQIDVREAEVRQRAVVCHIRTAQPHRHTAWQRFLSTGPIALLPLHDGRCSIVWTTTPDHARELTAQSDGEFCRAVEAASDSVLGRVEAVSTRADFPLRSVHAECYALERFALVGDAAHAVHPLAGQGVNLGFLDCAALAQTLGDADADPGELRLLRQYERWRKGENLLMLSALDGLNGLFSNHNPVLGFLRRNGLSLVDRVRPLKSLFMRRALGLAGDLPQVALLDA
ncbi:MAG TPA: FAD-dependent oxidoreductase [Steroidobacteraceae bacterium]|nr:FAD-dependent oxidoreductase [Steroidobacteraceae bacterium]